jgi:uncharacterized protein (TIGR03067 family)
VTKSDLSIRSAQIARALSATMLHAIVWGAVIYFLANFWEKPYIFWAKKNGFSMPITLSQSLKCWEMGLSHPNLSAVFLGVLACADFCIFMQFTNTSAMRLLRDLWFVTVLAIPLLFSPLLGIVQIEYFLAKQVDPYSVQFASPEVETEVNLLNGRWHRPDSSRAGIEQLNDEIDLDRIEFSNGVFQWESHEKGLARGMVYFESLRTPKHIKFVAMDPESSWTIRSGIYRLDGNQLVIMLPKWDSLSLPPPLDFEWDDTRYETLVLVREKAR